MQETLCNLAIVTIIGNLAALCAIPVVGIFWFFVGPATRDALDEISEDRRKAEAPTKEYDPRA